MAENSKIEWTDHTFNAWIGCAKVSPACKFCYAERFSERYGHAKWGYDGTRKKTSAANWKKPLSSPRNKTGMARRTVGFNSGHAKLRLVASYKAPRKL